MCSSGTFLHLAGSERAEASVPAHAPVASTSTAVTNAFAIPGALPNPLESATSSSTSDVASLFGSATSLSPFSADDSWLRGNLGTFPGFDAAAPLESSWLGELGVLASASPNQNTLQLDSEEQQSLNQLFHDLLGPDAFQTTPAAGHSGAADGGAGASGEGGGLGLPVPPDPAPQYAPVKNALSEFWKNCAELTALATSRPRLSHPEALPSIYDCTKGTHVLELLPTSFIWLNAFKIVHLPLLAGYANYMDTFFKQSHQVLCSAALVSGAAFIAVQRFDDDDECSNYVKRSTGEAFLNATGINLVDIAEAAASIGNQLGQIREKSTPAWEAFVDDPDVPVMSKVSVLYDIAMTEDLVDGAAKCAARLDKISALMSTVFPPTSTLNVSDLSGFQHQALGKWIGAEVFSSVLRNRRTCVNFTCNTVPYPDADDDPSMVYGTEWLFACPDTLLCALASISNLADDMRTDPLAYTSDGVLADHYVLRARALFSTVQNYNPRLRAHLRGSSLYNTARIAAQETWRQTAFIHYHQVIDRLPAHSPVVQACLDSLLDVYGVVEQGLPALLIGPMALTMFIASTVAVKPHHQHRLRNRHEVLQIYTGPRDCHRFIEKLWRTSFSQLGEGKLVEWHTLAAGEKPLAYV
ncbi:hypothetical protein JCM6882_004700 [Rhodosporidiobolus microsporus]